MCCAFWWLLNLRGKLIQGRIECEFRIRGHTQKSEGFETKHQKLTASVFRQNVSKQWSPPCGPCGLCELFRNVCISLRLFLAIPAEVASAERFFSKLNLLKNYLRFAMSQTRLVDLARLNIESSIATQVDVDSVIRIFAKRKPEECLYNG